MKLKLSLQALKKIERDLCVLAKDPRTESLLPELNIIGEGDRIEALDEDDLLNIQGENNLHVTKKWMIDFTNKTSTRPECVIDVSGIQISIPWIAWLESQGAHMLHYERGDYKVLTKDGVEIGCP